MPLARPLVESESRPAGLKGAWDVGWEAGGPKGGWEAGGAKGGWEYCGGAPH